MNLGNTGNRIDESTRAQVLRHIRNNPGEVYQLIADRFSIHHTTVKRIARQGGIVRVSPEHAAKVKVQKHEPNRREGGIIADDTQWRARQERAR